MKPKNDDWFSFHTTKTVRNKWEKLEHIGKAIFDIPFMIQSHAESIKTILGALSDLPAITRTANPIFLTYFCLSR